MDTESRTAAGIAQTPGRQEIAVSHDGIDEAWDQFLARYPHGRHEQTSRWAVVKAIDGWQAAREISLLGDQIVGGFQVLWKVRRPLGRVGYVSQGPMIPGGDSGQGDTMAESLVRAARALKLQALLVQPAMGCGQVEPYLRKAGFLPFRSRRLISSTGVLDLRLEEKELLQQMRPNRRRSIQKTLRGPLKFREGTREDLPDFFRLMQATCRRQQTSPNPSSLAIVQKIWDLFQPAGWMRLFVVSLEDEPVVASLGMTSGEAFLVWKIGWSGEYRELAPNDRMYWGAITWARNHDHASFDFVAIDPRVRSSPPTAGTQSGRPAPSFYKDSYRPRIVHLPRPIIWIRSPLLRTGYRMVSTVPSSSLLRSTTGAPNARLDPG